jgi:hypothetical protein
VNAAGVARGRLALLRASVWTRSRGRLRAREGAASAALALALGAALAWALAYAFSGLRAAGLAETDARALLGWLFTATIGGVLVHDLHLALAVLVAAPDLDLLRAAPLTSRELLTLRLLDALPRSLPLVLVLALPAALGFMAAYGAPGAGNAGTALALLGLWLAPLGLGIALALPLALALPPARARDLLGLLSTFALVLAWLANALLVPRAGLAHLAARGGTGFGSIPPPPAWTPSAWAAEALATGGHHGAALARLALAALLGLTLAAWSAGRHLEAALERTHDAPRRIIAGSRVRVARNWLGAFFARDARLFWRQWTVAADVLTASLLWMLLPLLAAPVLPALGPRVARAMLLLLAVGIGYEVGARSLALERGGLAWARLSPAGPMRWIAGRLAGVAVLSLALLAGAGTAVAVAFRLQPGTLPALAQWVGAAAAVSVSLGLLTGAAFADTAWSHPRAMLNVPGRLVGTALLVVQSFGWLWLGLEPAPVHSGVMLLAGLILAGAFLWLAGLTLGRREI